MKSCGSEGNGNNALLPNGWLMLLLNDQDTFNLGVSLIFANNVDGIIVVVVASDGTGVSGAVVFAVSNDDDVTVAFDAPVVVVVAGVAFVSISVVVAVIPAIVGNIVVNDDISLVTFITTGKTKSKRKKKSFKENKRKNKKKYGKMHNDKDDIYFYLYIFLLLLLHYCGEEKTLYRKWSFAESKKIHPHTRTTKKGKGKVKREKANWNENLFDFVCIILIHGYLLFMHVQLRFLHIQNCWHFFFLLLFVSLFLFFLYCCFLVLYILDAVK